MGIESRRHHRRSIRLKNYDYAQPGAYFVTVCTNRMTCLLGEIVDGAMKLNPIGEVVEEEWLKTPILRPNVGLDEYVVMPNHLHGIIMIMDHGRGVLQYAPTTSRFNSPSQTIGAIVRGFKSVVTKRINRMRDTPGQSVWQRNYYEHIIRSDKALNRIQEYIVYNPQRWHTDRYNPNRAGQDKFEDLPEGI